MLREFLTLYYKNYNTRILSYLIVSSIIIILSVYINQWLLVFTILSILLVVYYISLEIKQAKICIIFDTHNKQDLFYDEFHFTAVNNNKFTKAYKKWLLRTLLENNTEINYKLTAFQNINYFCIYCCITFIILMLVSSIILIYTTIVPVIVFDLIFIVILLVYYIFLHKKSLREECLKADSEIKRILFEEETGYSPLNNNKFTFKYKIWLIMKERNQNKTIFVNSK